MQTEEKLKKLRTENGDLRLPPAWTTLVFMLALAISCIALLILDMMKNNNGENILIIPIIIGLFAFAIFKGKMAESYILTRQKIICKRFGRVYREIPWSQVIQVGVTTGAGLRGNWYIVVTLEGAEKFDPKTQQLKKYIDEWEDKLLVLSAGRLRYAAFEKIYGKLDYDAYYHEQDVQPMKNYSDTDALVLAAIYCGGNDKSIKRTLDMLDHSVLNYGELAQSVNILAAGGLVCIDGRGMHVTEKAKPYLKDSENTGCIAQRFKVSEALCGESYDENAVRELIMPFAKEEYENPCAVFRFLKKLLKKR